MWKILDFIYWLLGMSKDEGRKCNITQSSFSATSSDNIEIDDTMFKDIKGENSIDNIINDINEDNIDNKIVNENIEDVEKEDNEDSTDTDGSEKIDQEVDLILSKFDEMIKNVEETRNLLDSVIDNIDEEDKLAVKGVCDTITNDNIIDNIINDCNNVVKDDHVISSVAVEEDNILGEDEDKHDSDSDSD